EGGESLSLLGSAETGLSVLAVGFLSGRFFFSDCSARWKSSPILVVSKSIVTLRCPEVEGVEATRYQPRYQPTPMNVRPRAPTKASMFRIGLPPEGRGRRRVLVSSSAGGLYHEWPCWVQANRVAPLAGKSALTIPRADSVCCYC